MTHSGNEENALAGSAPDIEAWREARERLEDRKRRIVDEIRSYPTPIAGCDAQFNHLLEERAAICRELQRLEEVIEKSRGGLPGAGGGSRASRG